MAPSDPSAADWSERPRRPDAAAPADLDEWSAPGTAEHPALGALAAARTQAPVAGAEQRARLRRSLARELAQPVPDMLFVTRLRRALGRLAGSKVTEEAVRPNAGPVPRAGAGSAR
jgi:hypothetical protein